MSEKQKAFSAGAIITSLFIAMIMSITTWVTIKASEVPLLHSKVEQVNKQLDRMDHTLSKLNAFIEMHNDEKVQWAVWKSKIDVKIENINKRISK